METALLPVFSHESTAESAATAAHHNAPGSEPEDAPNWKEYAMLWYYDWVRRPLMTVGYVLLLLLDKVSGPADPPRRRKSYEITPREHRQRMIFAGLAWVVSFVLTVLIMRWIFGWNSGSYFGVALWLFIFGFTLDRFVVIVPEVTALLTKNLLLRPLQDDEFANLHVYPVGLWIKYPWEVVKIGNFINLRPISVKITEDFNAQDGPALETTTIAFFRPDRHLLPRNIAWDGGDIADDLGAVVTGFLSRTIAEKPVEDARKSIKDMEADVRDELLEESLSLPRAQQAARVAGLQGYRANLEFITGSELVAVRIADADYETSYATALTNNAVAQLVQAHAQKLVNELGIDPKDAENAAMIVFKLVNKQIFEVEGMANAAQIIANAFTAIFAP